MTVAPTTATSAASGDLYHAPITPATHPHSPATDRIGLRANHYDDPHANHYDDPHANHTDDPHANHRCHHTGHRAVDHKDHLAIHSDHHFNPYSTKSSGLALLHHT